MDKTFTLKTFLYALMNGFVYDQASEVLRKENEYSSKIDQKIFVTARDLGFIAIFEDEYIITKTGRRLYNLL